MKEAPAKVHNFMEALKAPVLDKPFIYSTRGLEPVKVFWTYLPSASRSRNIKAYNFCNRLNKAQEEKPNESS